MACCYLVKTSGRAAVIEEDVPRPRPIPIPKVPLPRSPTPIKVPSPVKPKPTTPPPTVFVPGVCMWCNKLPIPVGPCRIVIVADCGPTGIRI